MHKQGFYPVIHMSKPDHGMIEYEADSQQVQEIPTSFTELGRQQAPDRETKDTFNGMIAGGALGAPFGPGGVVVGGLIGAAVGKEFGSGGQDR